MVHFNPLITCRLLQAGARATGIIGNKLARHLLDKGWKVAGLARRPSDLPDGVIPVAAGLRDPDGLRSGLASSKPAHVFYGSWLRQPTGVENIRVNSGMIRDLLDAVRPAGMSLGTGPKHYLGPV